MIYARANLYIFTLLVLFPMLAEAQDESDLVQGFLGIVSALIVFAILTFIFIAREKKKMKREEESCNKLLKDIPGSSETGERLPVREILAGQNLENAGKSGLSDHDITELMGYFSGVPGSVFRAAESVAKTLGVKTPICKKEVRRVFTSGYGNSVLSLALSLRSLDREFMAIYDTARGTIIETGLPRNILYMMLGIDKGHLIFEIIDKGPSRTLVIGTSEIESTNRMAFRLTDLGRGKRALREVFHKTEIYLHRITRE